MISITESAQKQLKKLLAENSAKQVFRIVVRGLG